MEKDQSRRSKGGTYTINHTLQEVLNADAE